MKQRFCSKSWSRYGAVLLILLGSRLGAHAQTEKPPEIVFNVQKVMQENVEGPDVERSYFPAGTKRIAFGVPKGCRLNADGARALIVLADAGLDGEIVVSRSPFSVEMDLAKEALKYREAAERTMPNGATEVAVQPPVMNPFPFNGWKSLGFTWSYSLSGRAMVRTVSYIDLEIGTQIIVTTLAAKKDAEQVNKIAKQFLSSWWVMAP